MQDNFTELPAEPNEIIIRIRPDDPDSTSSGSFTTTSSSNDENVSPDSSITESDTTTDSSTSQSSTRSAFATTPQRLSEPAGKRLKLNPKSH